MNHPGRHLIVFAVPFALLLLAGCGYSLVGRASNIPDDVHKVFVEPLVNSTPRPQVEQILTRALTDELVTRPRLDVVNAREDADAILRGTVVGFTVRPVTLNSEGLAESFEISITADVRFERRATVADQEPEVLWSNSRYVFREDYPVEGEGGEYFDRENLAIEETAVRFAETLITDLLEGF